MYTIGIDIGGTFTDCVVSDSTAQTPLAVSKALTTRGRLADGVVAALERAANELSVPLSQLLAETDVMVHGSTVATNAAVERKGAECALVTTLGHEDTLTVGRVTQKTTGVALHEFIDARKLRKADPPLVSRKRTLGAQERIDRDGHVVADLDEADLRRQLEALGNDSAVQAVAVCLLWSFVNDAHEVRVRELVAETLPGKYVVLSAEVCPILGEYERMTTTALTAYLGPVVVEYLEELHRRLQALGLQRRLLVIQSAGGLSGVETAVKTPLGFLHSGPIAGAMGVRELARGLGRTDCVFTDMGGTSFDVGVLQAGELDLNDAPEVGKYTYAVPHVDVSAMGAGGGSIVAVDEFGALHVGPESAGSAPGPACYARGGRTATVTDVNLILGLLSGDGFSGGPDRLDRDAALDALRPLAERLDVSPIEVATNAFRIVNAQMADLVTAKTIEKGIDPGGLTLIAYGGAGPIHAAFIAMQVGISEVIYPAQGSVFCAAGMLATTVTHVAQRSALHELGSDGEVAVSIVGLMTRLEDEVREQFGADGLADSEIALSRYLYMKYRGQVHEVRVLFARAPMDDDEIRAAFEDTYSAAYSTSAGYRAAGIEVTRCRLEGRALASEPARATGHPAVPAGSAPARAASGREITLPGPQGGSEKMDFVVLQDGDLEAGSSIDGPAVIERAGDTVVVPPGGRCAMDGMRNLIADVSGGVA